MRQRYMDFVPVAKESPVAVKETEVPKRTVTKTAVKTAAKPVTRVARPTAEQIETPKVAARKVVRAEAVKVETTGVARKVAFSGERSAKLGVIENLNSKFVETKVAKRPLSGARTKATRSEIEAIKAEKVGNKAPKAPGKLLGKVVGKTSKGVNLKKDVRPVVNKTASGASGASSAATGAVAGAKQGSTYVPPRSKFIAQAKLEKRPLSKTVYTKKVVAPKEEPKGPVTIIAKPEGQNHAGLIITIILTIILGAAAGTVAFLLLPK